nr:transposase [Bradyrhizobium sp. S69]
MVIALLLGLPLGPAALASLKQDGLWRRDTLLHDRHQDRHDGESYRRIELISGRKRRRSWSTEEKARILAESFAEGANISEVARQHGINRGLLFTWRRQVNATIAGHHCEVTDAGARSQPAFVPIVEIAANPSPEPISSPQTGVIELRIADVHLVLSGAVDAATLRVVLSALRVPR